MALLSWQQPLWADLVRRHYSGGLPHALMLTGVKGIGKHELSLYSAQWLLCAQAQQQKLSQPCGQCHSCQLWAAGSHPDFLLAQPEDKSRQIRIDTIRKVNEFLAQTPQISHCQVVILRPVEVMNTNAANALLKTLEEPAGESFLLLEAERFGSVLPTIRSRCQRIVVPQPSDEQSQQWLMAQSVEAQAAQEALHFNRQAPLAALAWLQQEQSQQQQRWLDLMAAWSLGRNDLQTVAEAFNKMELDDVIARLADVLADVLKMRLGVSAEFLCHSQWLEQLSLSTMVDIDKLITLQCQVEQVQANLMSGVSSYNKQLLIESLLLDWQQIVRSGKSG